MWGDPYIEIMEQVDYPLRHKSRRPIRCTEGQARAAIGKLHAENPAWRVIAMIPQHDT